MSMYMLEGREPKRCETAEDVKRHEQFRVDASRRCLAWYQKKEVIVSTEFLLDDEDSTQLFRTTVRVGGSVVGTKNYDTYDQAMHGHVCAVKEVNEVRTCWYVW